MVNLKYLIKKLHLLHFSKFEKIYSGIVLKITCQVNTVPGGFYLRLIFYYMGNPSIKLSIILRKNPITTLIRYVYCSKTKDNAINDIFIWYKRNFSFTKNSHFS